MFPATESNVPVCGFPLVVSSSLSSLCEGYTGLMVQRLFRFHPIVWDESPNEKPSGFWLG